MQVNHSPVLENRKWKYDFVGVLAIESNNSEDTIYS
jgi:hypothetical protein